MFIASAPERREKRDCGFKIPLSQSHENDLCIVHEGPIHWRKNKLVNLRIFTSAMDEDVERFFAIDVLTRGTDSLKEKQTC